VQVLPQVEQPQPGDVVLFKFAARPRMPHLVADEPHGMRFRDAPRGAGRSPPLVIAFTPIGACLSERVIRSKSQSTTEHGITHCVDAERLRAAGPVVYGMTRGSGFLFGTPISFDPALAAARRQGRRRPDLDDVHVYGALMMACEAALGHCVNNIYAASSVQTSQA